MRSATLLALMALGGCSLAFVRGPTMDGPTPVADGCSTSRVWPITDLVLALWSVAGGLGAIVEAADPKSNTDNTAQALIGVIPTSIAFGVSSVIGFARVGSCHDAL
ncbi:MAG: hypothetical protein WKG01_28760 [Kofleriaceae bacterium]